MEFFADRNLYLHTLGGILDKMSDGDFDEKFYRSQPIEYAYAIKDAYEKLEPELRGGEDK